jgi:hypothetical protein
MAYISNLLTHWAARQETSEQKKYDLLTQSILKPKRLRFSPSPLSVLSKFYPEKIVSCEMISFTDIPLSECESHCFEYSKFGISFDKAYLTNLHATPVAYSQNPAFIDNIKYIIKDLENLSSNLKKRDMEKFDYSPTEKDHTIDNNILPLLKYVLCFYEEYDKKKKFPYTGKYENENSYLEQKKFFENTKASYFEREWRVIPGTLIIPNIIKENGYQYFNFEEKYIKYIIMPMEFIDQFKKESNDIFSKYNKHNIPTVLAYEDLKYI